MANGHGGRRTNAGRKKASSVPDLNAAVECTSIREFLKIRGLTGIVPDELLDEFDFSVRRWREAEERLSKEGLTAPHPTTGAAIANPLVGVSKTYMQMMNSCWANIYQLIGSANVGNAEDEMESLLDG